MPGPSPPVVPVQERRYTVISALSGARLYILAMVACCILTVGAVVILTILQPQNTQTVTILVALMTPVIMALLAGAVNGALSVLDGNQSKLMSAIAGKEHLAGYLKGLEQNPDINVPPTDPAPTPNQRK